MSTILKRPAMMVAAALAAVAGQRLGMVEIKSEPTIAKKAIRSLRFLDLGSGTAWGRFDYRRGPGWTHAQVKRMARKAKNRRRHKLACRRAS